MSYRTDLTQLGSITDTHIDRLKANAPDYLIVMPNNDTVREMLHQSADSLRREVDHDVMVHPDRNVIVVGTGHVSNKLASFMAREGLEASPRIERTMCCDQHGSTAHVREMALSLSE